MGKKQIRAIANIQIEHLQTRLREKNLLLHLTDKALDHIAAIGYDPVYGARPLGRALRQALENPLAEALLRGEFLPGDTIHVDVKGDKFIYEK